MYDKENLKNIKEVRIITLGEPDVGKTSIIKDLSMMYLKVIK